MNAAEMEQLLRQAIAWCVPRAVAGDAKQLRTPELVPLPMNDDDLWHRIEEWYGPDTDPDYVLFKHAAKVRPELRGLAPAEVRHYWRETAGRADLTVAQWREQSPWYLEHARRVQEWEDALHRKTQEAVLDVCARRAKLLDTSGVTIKMLASPGRILVACSHGSMADGCSGQASEGFFDEDDLPPWDTWFGYTRNDRDDYILSWVPPSFISRAQRGIDCNVVACIDWAPQDRFPELIDLRAAGLVL